MRTPVTQANFFAVFTVLQDINISFTLFFVICHFIFYSSWIINWIGPFCRERNFLRLKPSGTSISKPQKTSFHFMLEEDSLFLHKNQPITPCLGIIIHCCYYSLSTSLLYHYIGNFILIQNTEQMVSFTLSDIYLMFFYNWTVERNRLVSLLHWTMKEKRKETYSGMMENLQVFTVVISFGTFENTQLKVDHLYLTEGAKRSM